MAVFLGIVQGGHGPINTEMRIAGGTIASLFAVCLVLFAREALSVPIAPSWQAIDNARRRQQAVQRHEQVKAKAIETIRESASHTKKVWRPFIIWCG
jgi:uncharacterized protein (UPF0218 family)